MSQTLPILSPLMEANAFAILHDDPEKQFQYNGVSATVNITDRPKMTCYYLDITFHNQIKEGLQYTDPETKEPADYFEFKPFKIARFRLEQDFIQNYLNHYEINVTVKVYQYLLLYYNYKDLKCDIRIYQADVNNGRVYGIDEEGEPLLELKNAFCIFKDKQDILKRIPKESIIPKTDDVKNANHAEQMLDNVVFQVIPNEDFDFRVSKVNAIFNECTIRNAIWTIAESTKCVEAIMLVDPDNTKEYKNLIIPPILSIQDTLNFMQSYYGIYNKGLSFFYEFGILYVFPAYETKPVLPKDKSEAWGSSYKTTSFTTVNGPLMMDETGDGGMTHIYAVGNNSYTGMQYYHGYEENTIHIVTNSKSVFKDLADEGVENMAYAYVVAHNDRVVDDWRVIRDAKDQPGARYGVWPINVMEDPNTTLLAEEEQNAKYGITSTKANKVFTFDKSNMCAVESRLNSYKRTLTVFDWKAAVPLTFRPGYKICYHFDHEDESARDLGKESGDSLKYATKNGTVVAVEYTMDITKHVDERYIHACNATVTASLELETTYHKDGI